MSKNKIMPGLYQSLLETIDGARGDIKVGRVDLALGILRGLEEAIKGLEEIGTPIDDGLQAQYDALSREVATAQQHVNDDGGDAAPKEVNDGGGVAAAQEPQDNYGACRQNATGHEGYVALAGGDEDAKGGPCDNCVIL